MNNGIFEQYDSFKAKFLAENKSQEQEKLVESKQSSNSVFESYDSFKQNYLSEAIAKANKQKLGEKPKQEKEKLPADMKKGAPKSATKVVDASKAGKKIADNDDAKAADEVKAKGPVASSAEKAIKKEGKKPTKGIGKKFAESILGKKKVLSEAITGDPNPPASWYDPPDDPEIDPEQVQEWLDDENIELWKQLTSSEIYKNLMQKLEAEGYSKDIINNAATQASQEFYKNNNDTAKEYGYEDSYWTTEVADEFLEEEGEEWISRIYEIVKSQPKVI